MGNLVDQATAQYKALIATQQSILSEEQTKLNNYVTNLAVLRDSQQIASSSEFAYPTIELVNYSASGQPAIKDKVSWKFLRFIGDQQLIKGPLNFTGNWGVEFLWQPGIFFYNPVFPLSAGAQIQGAYNLSTAKVEYNKALSYEGVVAGVIASTGAPIQSIQAAWANIRTTLGARISAQESKIAAQEVAINEQKEVVRLAQERLNKTVADSQLAIAEAQKQETTTVVVDSAALVKTTLKSDVGYQTTVFNQTFESDKIKSEGALALEKLRAEQQTKSNLYMYGGIGFSVVVLVVIVLYIVLKK